MCLYRFSEENVQKLEKSAVSSIIQRFNIPIAKLRFLPKKSTFRPLMTFFRKSGTFKENPKETAEISKQIGNFNENSKEITESFRDKARKMSLNEILSDVHTVLRSFKEKLGESQAFAVFDNEQIARKYREFVEKWRAQGENRKKLWFLTMDIRKCYDSIEANRLLAMIKDGDLLVIH